MRGGWPRNWNAFAVPLSNIQADVLQILATRRNPESYVAGATPLNRDALRFSQDIDLFHDREERVALTAEEDRLALRAAGYQVTWLRRLPAVYTAEVRKGEVSARLEWVVDSDFRFFPTIEDDVFGFVLHPVDLAINKVMAAAGRREVRDLVDLTTIHETIFPLGALVWAAVEKSPGFTPEGLIAEIRRNIHHPNAEWASLSASDTLDPRDITNRVRAALDQAEAFVRRMPTDKLGVLFLEGGIVVQPDPDRLADYTMHAGARRGHWPSDPEIMTAMMDAIVGSCRRRIT